MISQLVKEVLDEVGKPQVQGYIKTSILNPLLRYVMSAFSPYFWTLCILLVAIVSLQILTLYRR